MERVKNLVCTLAAALFRPSRWHGCVPLPLPIALLCAATTSCRPPTYGAAVKCRAWIVVPEQLLFYDER